MTTRRAERAIAAVAVLTMALLAASCTEATTSTPEAAVLRLELLSCGTGNEQRATAVAVADGLAVTVAHALADIERFETRDRSGRRSSAEVVFLDTDRDLAVLRLSTPTEEHLRLRLGSGATDVRFVTFADEDGPETADAVVLRRTRVSLDGVGDRLALELAAEIEAGDSGGPVIDDDDRMIGMVFATSRTGDRGWAVDASELEPAVSGIDAQTQPIPLVCG